MSLIISTKTPNFISDSTTKKKVSTFFSLGESSLFANKLVKSPIDLQGLISYWKLDESSGAAVDSYGPNTLTNTNVTYSTGKIANGGVFNGSNSYLERSNASQVGLNLTGDLSFSLWYKPAAQISGNAHMLVTKFDYISGNQRGYQFYYEDETGTGGYRLTLGLSVDGSATAVKRFNVTLSPSLWYHIVCVYKASQGSVEVFVNNTSLGVQTGMVNSIFNCTSAFRIGANIAGLYANGVIDEVSVWNRPLAAADVNVLFNGASGIQYPFGAGTFLSIGDVYAISEAETKAYYNNLIATQGTISGNTLYAVNTFVKNLKLYGLWDKLDDIGIFCGNNLAAALTKLKQTQGYKSLVNHNFVEADFIERGSTGGLIGNGSSKYLDSGHNVSTLPLDNLSLGIYWNGSIAGQATQLGLGEDQTNRFTLFTNNGGTPAYAIATNGVYNPARSMTGGLQIGTRLPGTNVSASQNGDFSTWGTADGPASLFNETTYVMARNENGTAVSLSSNRICYYHIGRGLTQTDCGNYYNIVQAFQTTLGRQI